LEDKKEGKMRKVRTLVVIAGLLISLTASAEDKQAPKVMNKIAPLPRDLEIQLAFSALLLHLKDNATVYVLNPDKASKLPARVRTGSMPLLPGPAMIRLEGPCP
jgi:hypothetical protein